MNLVTIESLLTKPVCMMTGEELALKLAKEAKAQGIDLTKGACAVGAKKK